MTDFAGTHDSHGDGAQIEDTGAVPAMPEIERREQWQGSPFLILDLPQTIGWQWLPPQKGGPSFVLTSRTRMGSLRVTDQFALTPDGWAAAWQVLAAASPESAEKCRIQLAKRVIEQQEKLEQAEIAAGTYARLTDVALLGGYSPKVNMAIGGRYDVWFGEEKLVVFAQAGDAPLTEVMYPDIEDIEIGGPGVVKSGGGFTGGGFGAVGALEGMAIAAVLNALTTRTSIVTVVRIQAMRCELFFLHTRLTPDQLRMDMSRALGAIRAAKPSQVAPAGASPVAELAKLAEMLQAGLITREEFDQFKARLLHS